MWIQNGRYTDDLPDKLQDIPNGEYWSIKDYAENEKLPESTVRTWIRGGQLKAFLLNGRYYIEIGTRAKKRKYLNK